jgi:homoserine dehydrogenase
MDPGNPRQKGKGDRYVPIRIVVAGLGQVGRAFVRLLNDKRDQLAAEGLDLRLCGVYSVSRGSAALPHGLDIGEIQSHLDRFANLRNVEGGGTLSLEQVLERAEAEVLLDASATNLKTGEPGRTNLLAALRRGMDGITCSKGPVYAAWDELRSAAETGGRILRYEGTVMSGTPLISLIREGMSGNRVRRIEGILNGTTNFILSRTEEGAPYEAALREAQEAGYAEADPTADVDGWDAAVKLAILARALTGERLDVEDIFKDSLTPEAADRSRRALAAGNRLKVVATLERAEPNPPKESGETGPIAGTETPIAPADVSPGLRARVELRELPGDHPLARIRGARNAAAVETDLLGTVTIEGPGAGPTETAAALLSDLMTVTRHRKG